MNSLHKNPVIRYLLRILLFLSFFLYFVVSDGQDLILLFLLFLLYLNSVAYNISYKKILIVSGIILIGSVIFKSLGKIVISSKLISLAFCFFGLSLFLIISKRFLKKHTEKHYP